MKKKKFKIIKLKKKHNFSYKRKILISNLSLMLSVGIHDFEKTKKQEVMFNISLSINPYLYPLKEDLNSIINYETVIKTITQLTRNNHYDLLESLAEDIFSELFKNTNIHLVKLRIEKTQIIKNTSSVGIEIIKKRL